MRTFKTILLSVFTLVGMSSYAQEYDDLYFTKKDRKKLKPVEEQITEEKNETSGNTSFLGRQFENYSQEEDYLIEDVSTNQVSQEAIDRYKRSELDEGYEEQAYVDNPNYSVPEESFQDQNVIINNYYGANNWRFNRWRPGWRFGLGWNTWGGAGFGFSYGWGGWYDPFFYDPWIGWNSWGGFYDPFWCPPFFGNSIGYYRGFGRFYNPYYRRPIVIASNDFRGRSVRRGGRNSRGGTVSSTSGRRQAVGNASIVGSTNDSRDFSRSQAKYLDRSRRNRSTEVSSTNGTRSVTTRNRTGSVNTNTRSRSNGVSSNRRSDNSTYSRSSNGSSRRTYNRSSNSSSRSGSYNRSSNSSRSGSYNRSSGSSSRSGSFNRSSSSSRSRSGSFRSSGSSSRSRSSGSSGRSSSRSRRGN